jgi:hypothetical protein
MGTSASVARAFEVKLVDSGLGATDTMDLGQAIEACSKGLSHHLLRSLRKLNVTRKKLLHSGQGPKGEELWSYKDVGTTFDDFPEFAMSTLDELEVFLGTLPPPQPAPNYYGPSDYYDYGPSSRLAFSPIMAKNQP